MRVAKTLCVLLAMASFALAADDVPEISGSMASTALALVGGVVLTIRGRRAK